LRGRGRISYIFDMKTFWQHANGKVYAIESDTFGRVVGATGPLELDQLRDPTLYRYQHLLVPWVTKAISQRRLHRINPAIHG
jgi:hypothetical protein